MPRLPLACVALALTTAAAGGQDAALWRGDLAAALAEAKRSGKPVLVDFGAEWCGACKTLDATAFRDPGVRKRLAAGFVPVKLDVDHNESAAEKYHVRSLPTLLVLGPDGRELGRRTGSGGAGEITQWLAPFRPTAPSRPPAPVAAAAPADPWAACHRELSAALGRGPTTGPRP